MGACRGPVSFRYGARRGSARQLDTIAPDGSDLRNLTNDPNTDADAAYSSDGSQIAFYSLRDGDSEIYTAAVNGTDVTQLTTSGDNVDPAFSPGGSRIAFTAFATAMRRST